jgi:hypothetical protein
MKFAQLARSVTRRGDFVKHVVEDITGRKKTWISTSAADVFITDVRDGSMISPDQVISVLNQAPRVAKLLEELAKLEEPLSVEALRAKLEPFV